MVSHENDLSFMRMKVQVTYIFIPIILHKDLFCYRGKSKLGIGLFIHELLREPLILIWKISNVHDGHGELAVNEKLIHSFRFLSFYLCMYDSTKFTFALLSKMLSCGWVDSYLQLFRQRLSHKSVKAYATMPTGIMGRKSLALID